MILQFHLLNIKVTVLPSSWEICGSCTPPSRGFTMYYHVILYFKLKKKTVCHVSGTQASYNYKYLSESQRRKRGGLAEAPVFKIFTPLSLLGAVGEFTCKTSEPYLHLVVSFVAIVRVWSSEEMHRSNKQHGCGANAEIHSSPGGEPWQISWSQGSRVLVWSFLRGRPAVGKRWAFRSLF